MHSSTIEMREQYPRESEESFGKGDVDGGEEIVAGTFEGGVGFAF